VDFRSDGDERKARSSPVMARFLMRFTSYLHVLDDVELLATNRDDDGLPQAMPISRVVVARW
jgi:hypothetical protein